MSGLDLARKFASKSLSNFTLNLNRQKSKCISIFQVARVTTNDWKDRVLFFVLPIKRNILLKPVLTDKELERIRPELRKAIERQAIVEEASRNLKQFAGSHKNEKEEKKTKVYILSLHYTRGTRYTF